VLRLRPGVLVEHTLARVGAERLWRLLQERDHLPALGALTGGQAVQMVKAGVVPIVADAEAGFGGPLNAYELTGAMIAAGAAGVHFEDQLASEKKCGHLGGKVLVPTGAFIRTLQAARLAADVAGVPTVLLARTDALAYAPYADLLWCETSTPDLGQAQAFAEAVHAEFPGKPLAYNSLNAGMFELARGYAAEGMPAYVRPPAARAGHGGRRLHRHPPPA
jgi:isocitrate lyase